MFRSPRGEKRRTPGPLRRKKGIASRQEEKEKGGEIRRHESSRHHTRRKEKESALTMRKGEEKAFEWRRGENVSINYKPETGETTAGEVASSIRGVRKGSSLVGGGGRKEGFLP